MTIEVSWGLGLEGACSPITSPEPASAMSHHLNKSSCMLFHVNPRDLPHTHTHTLSLSHTHTLLHTLSRTHPQSVNNLILTSDIADRPHLVSIELPEDGDDDDQDDGEEDHSRDDDVEKGIVRDGRAGGHRWVHAVNLSRQLSLTLIVDGKHLDVVPLVLHIDYQLVVGEVDTEEVGAALPLLGDIDKVEAWDSIPQLLLQRGPADGDQVQPAHRADTDTAEVGHCASWNYTSQEGRGRRIVKKASEQCKWRDTTLTHGGLVAMEISSCPKNRCHLVNSLDERVSTCVLLCWPGVELFSQLMRAEIL